MPYPTYEKLAVNGHGLALTQLQIRKNKSGTSWGKRPIFEKGSKYRVRLRFTNFHRNIEQVGVPHPTKPTSIGSLTYTLRIPSTAFFKTEAFSGTSTQNYFQQLWMSKIIRPEKSLTLKGLRGNVWVDIGISG